MDTKSDNIIDSYSGEDFTKVTFTPDYKKFGMKNLDDDTFSLLAKRVYDLAGVTNKKV